MKIKNLKSVGRARLLKFIFLSIAIVLVTSAGLIFFHENFQPKNQFIEVTHPFTGSAPKLLTDVSYDVDSNRSLSINNTEYIIENAQDIAKANNWGAELYSKFHFWPNMFDLTEIYFQDKDLYNKIVNEILEKNPDRDAIIIRINSEVSKGDRIFLARDFIPIVKYNGRIYYEVHYGFIINLDEKYIKEILIHNETVLHDSHVDELTKLFNKTNLLDGQIWEICLRGNIKRAKYNSIIVDRLNNSGFFIERVHLSCGCYHYFEENLSWIPKIPFKKFPPPKPEEKIPLPSKNPNHTQPPFIHPKKNGGVTTPSPPMRPWPFPNPEPEDTTPIPSSSQGESEPIEGCPENEELLQQKHQLLENLNITIEKKIERFNKDIRNLNNNFSYSYSLAGEWIDNTKFNNPCIEELYNSYNEKVQVIKNQINKLREEQGNISNAIKSLAKQLGCVIDSYRHRSSLWQNMLHGDSDSEWTKVNVPCGGGIIMPGPSSSMPTLNVTPKQQMDFRKDVLSAVMNGKTWEEAVKEATLKNIPKNNNWGNPTWKKIWEMYADCLEKLYKKQFRIFLKNDNIYPGCDDEEIEKMINVMFNGYSALTSKQKKQLNQFNKQKEEYLKQQKKIDEAIEKLNNQIDDLRWKFRDEVRKKCLTPGREEINKTRQTIWIIESFLKYCRNHNGTYKFKYIDTQTLCATLNEMLSNPAYNSNLGLKEFIQLLIKNHCR